MSRPIYPKPKSETNHQDAVAGTNNSSIPAKKISFEELHKKLQARLQNHGIINDLRAELRAKLVHELYEIADPVKAPNMMFGGSEDSQFPLQVSNWLVCNHFQRGNFEFTLSTFLRESSIVTLPEYNMTFHDVLYIFGIHPHTDFYKTIYEKYKNEKSSGGLLFFIVQHLLMCILPQSMKNYTDSSTETENALFNEDRLNMKVLHEIEYVRQKLDNEIKNALESKAMKESKKDNSCDKCQTKTEIGMPTNLQLARRENEQLQKLLESAEVNLKKQEMEFEQKNKAMEARIISQNSMENNGNLTQGILKVNLEKSQIKIRELESHLELIKEQNNIVQKQNKSFQSMLESMSDYEVVKSDLSLTRRERDLSQTRYQEAINQWLTTKEELENKVAQLTLQITSPCLQLLSASQEVQKVLEKSQVEQSTWSQERSHWQGELKKATQAHHRELVRVEEQKQHIENLHQVIHNLQLQLEKAHLAKAENSHVINTFRPNPSANTYPNYLPKSTQSTFRNDFELSETFMPPEKEQDIRSFSPSPSPNSRSDYIKEAKLRIDQLQAEADSLERKYGQCMKNQRTFASPCQPYQSNFSQFGRQNIYHIPDAHYLNAGSPFTHQHVFVNESPYIRLPDSFIPHSNQTGKVTNSKYDQSFLKKPMNNSVIHNESLHTALPKHLIGNPNYRLNPSSNHLDSVTSQYPAKPFHAESHAVSNTHTANNSTSFIPENNYGIDTDNNHVVKNSTANSTYKDSVVNTEHIVKENELVTEEFKVSELSISEKVLIAPSSSITSAKGMNDTPDEEIPGKLSDDNCRLSFQNPKELPNDVEEAPNKILAQNPQRDDPGKVTALNLDEAWKQISVNTSEKKRPSYEPPIPFNLDAEWRKNLSSVVSLPPFEDPKNKSTGVEAGILSFNKNNIVLDKVEESIVSVPENRTTSPTVPFIPSVGRATETSLSNVELTRNGQVMNMMDFNPYQHSTPVTLPDGNGVEQNDIEKGTGNDSDINLSIGDQGQQSGNSNSESMW